mgnify:CR=1 FL=1
MSFETGFVNVSLSILNKSLEIVKQPIKNIDMLWILLPLLATLFIIEFYFGSHKGEELGWNSAVGNSIILFFVGMNLFSFLWRNGLLVGISQNIVNLEIASFKTFIAIFVTIEAIFLIIVDFFHLLPKNFGYGMSSPLILNFIGVVSIIFVYSNIELTWHILPATLILFICLFIFIKIIRLLLPKIKEGSKFSFGDVSVGEEELKKGKGEGIFSR